MPHSTLLSDLERRRIHAFLKADGERISAVRGLATRCRQNLPRIEADLKLIRDFLDRYALERNEK
jgi:hypothetical protein